LDARSGSRGGCRARMSEDAAAKASRRVAGFPVRAACALPGRWRVVPPPGPGDGTAPRAVVPPRPFCCRLSRTCALDHEDDCLPEHNDGWYDGQACRPAGPDLLRGPGVHLSRTRLVLLMSVNLDGCRDPDDRVAPRREVLPGAEQVRRGQRALSEMTLRRSRTAHLRSRHASCKNLGRLVAGAGTQARTAVLPC
jgi:hypothetical protein